MSAVTHVAWISNSRLLGGFYGAEVLLPLADLSTSTRISDPTAGNAAWGI